MKNAYLKYIASLLLFGSNGTVASQIPLTSYHIVLLRTLVGSLILAALFFLARRKLTFFRHRTANPAESLPKFMDFRPFRPPCVNPQGFFAFIFGDYAVFFRNFFSFDEFYIIIVVFV